MNEEQLREWHDSVCEAMSKYDCDTIVEVFEKGYRKGGRDMEKAKQIVIDELINQLEILESGGCDGCEFVKVEEWEMPCAKCKRNCKDYWRAKEIEE